MRLMGLGKAKEVKRLNDDMAVELGAEMLGEVIVYSIASLTVFWEYMRQKRKDERHEDSQNIRLIDLESQVKELSRSMEKQKTQIRELTRVLQSNLIPNKIVDPHSGTVLRIDKRKVS